MKKGFVIAIDGPVGAGKGTVSSHLAKRLHGFHLYTGAMYRCVTLLVIQHAIDIADEQAVEQVVKSMEIRYENDHIILNGEDVTERIKQQDVVRLVSPVSEIALVRKNLVERQRALGLQYIDEGTIVIAEGRDMVTRVFPDAVCKIFLTADVSVRAQRRLLQMQEMGVSITFETVLADVIRRDTIDSSRTIDPLPHAPEEEGYVVIDDSTHTEEETLNQIMQLLSAKGLL
jgi:cytidylate kinase